MAECRETTWKATETINRNEKLREEIKETLSSSDQLEKRYKEFQDSFGNLMSAIAKNLSAQLAPEEIEYKH